MTMHMMLVDMEEHLLYTRLSSSAVASHHPWHCPLLGNGAATSRMTAARKEPANHAAPFQDLSLSQCARLMLSQNHRSSSKRRIGDCRRERLPSSKSREFIQVGQAVHEGGDVGDQLHGPGEGIRASGAGLIHSVLQGLHYHLHTQCRPERQNRSETA